MSQTVLNAISSIGPLHLMTDSPIYKGDVDVDVDVDVKLEEGERFYNLKRPHGAHDEKTPSEGLWEKL